MFTFMPHIVANLIIYMIRTFFRIPDKNNLFATLLKIYPIYSLLEPCSIVHRIYPIIEKHSAAPCTQINTLSRIEHCTVGRNSPSIYYSQGRQPNILTSSFPLLYHCMAASEQTLKKANFDYD